MYHIYYYTQFIISFEIFFYDTRFVAITYDDDNLLFGPSGPSPGAWTETPWAEP